MPNDAQISLRTYLCSLEELQIGLEEAVFSTKYKDHLNLLQSIKTLLISRVDLSPRDADRLLSICLKYITDVRCILDVFSIMSELIDIDKDNSYVDFAPFGIALLKFLNTKCHEANTIKLRILSLQLLMKHPKSTLQIIIRHHSENIIQSFEPIFGLKHAEDLPSKIEAFKILTMLEWLPHNEKRLFMEAGISLWLSGVIPAMMQIVVSDEDVNNIEACLSCTEMLASELVYLNYYENQHWKSLLLCIANPQMFPASIMTLFEKGQTNWHRIWIILIKIVKSQVIQTCSPFASPINSMLPIVETAFKKESAQRVRAFACWDELIQSFSNDMGNHTKRIIKLIMTPLKLYNAKTVETVVAKFNTWWHLIHKFRPKIKDQQSFINDILIYFLNFMFGKDQTGLRFQAAQFSDDLRKRCIEAFEEIMNLKRLDGNISTINLLDHWKDFVYILKSCIWAVAQSYTQDTKEKVQSIWMSFVMRLAAMAENTVRQNMFDDLVNIVSALILENENIGNVNLMEILVDDITLSLWRDNKLKTLTKSRSQSYRPMHSIVKLIMDDQFNNYFERFNSAELTRLLQPLIRTLIEESISKPEYIIWLLDELRVTNTTLVMWTALAQASKETKLSLEAFNKILIWPFKTVNISCEVKEAAEAWYILYNKVHENLEKTNFYNEISKVMKRPVEDSKASNYFVLLALIGVLKHKPDVEKMEKLEALTYEMNDYSDLEELLTPLVKSVVLMINNSTDENLAHITMNCVENILKGIKSETEATSGKSPIQNRTMLSDTITSTLKTYLEKCPYQSIKNQVRSLLSSYDKKTESPKKVSKSPKKVNDSPDVTYLGFSGWGHAPKEFASPEVQKLKKIKKEPSIVAKVVENGEEYVVIKPNWKFNPKNLTENQKEKFQRKKCDIPALYGDQSQSQEFNLTSWKTDSQDTSLSSSKSATSNDVSDTLKKITNSNLVPKIMENILDIGKNSKTKTDATVSPIAEVKTPKAVIWSTPGGTKSPRMALKDRVCRNVRNLIGNSSPSPQNKMTDKQEDTILQNVSKSPLHQPEIVCKESPAKISTSAESNENNLKPSNEHLITTDKQDNNHGTPPSMKKNIVSTQRIDQMMRLACTPVSQSPAPKTSSVERPTRLKKPPKKFDDALVSLKRRRYAKNDSQSNSQDWLESHTETVVAQIHNPNDKMEFTDANSPQKLTSNEADTNENEKKTPTTTEVVIIVENVTSCAASDDKSHRDSEKTSSISPQTSINKPTAKSPVKSSKGEVQCSLSKASEVVDNDAAENETFDVKDKPNVTATPSVTAAKDLNQSLLSGNTSVLPNDTDKKSEKIEVVSTPITETKKDSDTSQLPLSKSKELQITLKRENLLTTPKAQRKKKSRIENELAIDMVEGHPFLKIQSAKRITRKKLMEVDGSKRKTLVDKLNKSELRLTSKTPKKNKTPLVNKANNVSPQTITDEPPCSEDVIESSQDSTMTTISVNAKMRTVKRVPIVTLEKINLPITLTQDLLQDCNIVDKTDTDIDLPQNKSVVNKIIDSTENMDTEPIGDSENTTDLTENMDTETLSTNETDDPIILSETLPTPVTVNSETEPVIGPETQELAEADTQPNDIQQFEQWEINKPLLTSPNSNHPESSTIEDNDITQSLPEEALIMANMDVTTDVSSPLKDDNQRKQDFLNNTVEISPIKVQSPDRQKKSPTPEISTDFVIQLSSPVHSNGEPFDPFDKQCSPEFFTEDKNNASPPRVVEIVTNSSPSASLSLKKNRPQVNRPCSGRAAQMLANVSYEMKNHSNRALICVKYTGNDCSVEENASTVENFLKLQGPLPTVTSSPSGPILKRKLDEIIDDSTASPASKKKRVSFHDPPVSNTVSIQKYIEPLTRSPQTLTKKRQTRSGLKSPKKLDNAFLDSALSKTVESFTEATTPSDETENISLDVTPVVEIVKTSDLNDTDPICPDLIDCTDPIDVIAIELSCAAMRDLFVKELEGKVDTVGDLAKMTELEVNRLCIKAPKITVAKKVLTDYITNRPAIAVETVIEGAFSEPMTESLLHESKSDVEVQTDEVEVVTKSTQVAIEEVTSAETQTEVVVSANTSVQTIESGCKTIEEIIDSCLSEANSFEILKGKLNAEQVESIANLQSEKTRFRRLVNNMDASTLIHKTLKHQSKGIPKSNKPSVELMFLKEVFEKYEKEDLIKFCIEMICDNKRVQP